jgi:hypothetical protein
VSSRSIVAGAKRKGVLGRPLPPDEEKGGTARAAQEMRNDHKGVLSRELPAREEFQVIDRRMIHIRERRRKETLRWWKRGEAGGSHWAPAYT